MENIQKATRGGIRSHHLPQTTTVAPIALLGSLRASELGVDRYREDRFAEEGAGVVSQMIALRT